MRLVVDSNILFAALIRNSTTRKIFTHLNAEFFLVTASNEEIQKYKAEILEKSEMNDLNFTILLTQLKSKCIELNDFELLPYWENAKKIMDGIDPKDTVFIAAALAVGADIWTDDKHFLKQKRIKVWKTEDLMKQL